LVNVYLLEMVFPLIENVILLCSSKPSLVAFCLNFMSVLHFWQLLLKTRWSLGSILNSEKYLLISSSSYLNGI